MIYKQSYLIPADRCGVFWVKVFHLYGGWYRKVSYVGNFVKVSVRDTRTNNKLKKKTKITGVIIRVKKETFKSDKTFLKFKKNNVILLKRRMTPKGKEIMGPILWIIRRRKFRASFPKIL